MLRRQNNRLLSKEKRRTRDSWDLNELLHPARAFGHPSVVVNNSDLTLNEKRAILASWASDACAEDVAPDSRRLTSRRTNLATAISDIVGDGGRAVLTDVLPGPARSDTRSTEACAPLDNPEVTDAIRRSTSFKVHGNDGPYF